MKLLLLPLLAALALPNTVNAEKLDITCFWRMEDKKPDSDEAIDRFVIDTELDKGSLISYKKGTDGKKKFLEKYMVEFINSPMQIEVIQDLGYELGTSYVFDKKDISSPVVTDIVKKYGSWVFDNDYQTRYRYFNCKKTPMFF